MACVIEVIALAEDFFLIVFRNRTFVLPPKLRVICSTRIALLYYLGSDMWSGAFDATVKVKVKFILAEEMKTRGEVGEQLYSSFNLCAGWG
jgi:hypothetical protein